MVPVLKSHLLMNNLDYIAEPLNLFATEPSAELIENSWQKFVTGLLNLSLVHQVNKSSWSRLLLGSRKMGFLRQRLLPVVFFDDWFP